MNTTFNLTHLNPVNITLVSANQSFESEFDMSLIYFYYLIFTIGYGYIYTVICVIGTVLNLICIFVYMNSKFEGTMYKYLINKTFFELLTLAVSILSPFSSCQDCTSYVANVYRLYVMRVIINMTYTCSGFAEIATAYDKLLLFKTNSKYFRRVPFKIFFIVSVTISILMFVPHFFSYKVYEKRPNEFDIKITTFGQSAIFNVYGILIYTIQNAATFTILIGLNYMIYSEYKLYFQKKTKLLKINNEKKSTQVSDTKIKRTNQFEPPRAPQANNAKSNESERKFTMMIMSSGTFFIISRILESITYIITHVDKANQVSINRVLNVIEWFAHLATYVSFSSNIFFSLMFNKLFRGHFLLILNKIIHKLSCK
jgi:hypothetical protein